MDRKVIWAEIAWSDLENAADYIAKDSANYAAAFVSEARDAARSLTNLAERGRVVPEFNNQHLRELFVRNYRMIYQLTKDKVYILGFIHGSRDLWKLWGDEKRVL